MTKLPITIAFLLLGGLFIGTCSNTVPAASSLESISYAAENFQAEEYTISIPLLMSRYPLTPVFGIEARNYHNTISEANVHWLRLNGIRWSLVQPNGPGSFDWNEHTNIESNIVAASENGLETILILRGTPEWAQKYPGKFCGPIKEEHLSSFAAFANEVVKRYSQPPYNVRYFQIWNEPDAPVGIDGNMPFGCWGEPTGDFYGGEYYAEMLKVAYPAMKSANPMIKVVLGALLLDCDPTGVGEGYCQSEEARHQWNFFEGILRNNGAFDVVAFHGYAFYSSQEKPVMSERNHPNWRGNGGVVDGKLNYLRGLMNQYGVFKPIMQTEAALVNTHPAAPTDELFQAAKADYAVWVMARNWGEGLLGTTWYSLEGWRNSGLIDSNQQPLPAYNSLKNMATVLDEAEFVSRDVHDGYERFIFRKAGERIWLLIPTTGSYDAQVSIVVPPGLVKVENIFGDNHPFTSTIEFSRPIYLYFNQ
jgi:hypothetical protein